MIRIINYDAGNILNVNRAFHQIGVESIITSDLDDLDIEKDLLVLPGVGSFGATMESLNNLGLTAKITDYINNGGKFLGICLGLQLLFSSSEESPGIKGLSLFPEDVVKFPKDKCATIPQIGWNTLQIENDFFKEFNDKFFYFVHSFYVPKLQVNTLSSTEYGIEFTSAIIKDNLIATQFHPEKSGEVGLSFLKKVLEYYKI